MADIWLREAFAPFRAVLECEREAGLPAARERMEVCRQAYLGLREAGVDRPLMDLSEDRMEIQIARTRGVWFFWMLRRSLGEASYARSEAEIAAAETEADLKAVVGRHVGQGWAVDAFFDYWLRGTDLPDYQLLSARAHSESGGYVVTVRIANRGAGTAAVPGGVPIVVRTEEGARHYLPASVPGGETRDLAYPLVTRPVAAAVDPEGEVLGAHPLDSWQSVRLRRWGIFW